MDDHENKYQVSILRKTDLQFDRILLQDTGAKRLGMFFFLLKVAGTDLSSFGNRQCKLIPSECLRGEPLGIFV